MRTLIITYILLGTIPVYAVEIDTKSFSKRLKFKNGPVCMCADGLSEKDIKIGSIGEQALGKKNSVSGNLQQSQQLEMSQSRDKEDK